MRGKEYLPAISLDTCRITPAYAGKSSIADPHQVLCQDHPRLCGEKQRVEIVTGSRAGSPPPMRGKELTHATL